MHRPLSAYGTEGAHYYASIAVSRKMKRKKNMKRDRALLLLLESCGCTAAAAPFHAHRSVKNAAHNMGQLATKQLGNPVQYSEDMRWDKIATFFGKRRLLYSVVLASCLPVRRNKTLQCSCIWYRLGTASSPRPSHSRRTFVLQSTFFILYFNTWFSTRGF